MRVKLALLILFFPIFFGCFSHQKYVQNIHQVPLFTDTSQFVGRVALGASDVKSTEFQVAFSLSQKYALMGSLMFLDGGSSFKWSGSSETINNSSDGFYFDAAFGYFKPINKYLIFETYSGYGYGETGHKSNSSIYTKNSWSESYHKLFIQPNLGFTSNYFDLGASLRISQLLYGNDNFSSKPISDRLYYLLEPAGTMRFGYKGLKLELQMAYSNLISGGNLSISEMKISLGLCLLLRKWNE